MKTHCLVEFLFPYRTQNVIPRILDWTCFAVYNGINWGCLLMLFAFSGVCVLATAVLFVRPRGSTIHSTLKGAVMTITLLNPTSGAKAFERCKTLGFFFF